jgi:hypothetical protein
LISLAQPSPSARGLNCLDRVRRRVLTSGQREGR